MLTGRNRRIHCKWCSYTTPIWYTSKAKKRSSGWIRMAFHIIDQHPEHEAEARELTADEYGETA